MNKKIIRYISAILINVIALTSVMQFHHHDCDGNIYIHLTTLDDLYIGHTHSSLEHCNNSHKTEHNDCNGKHSNCSMHLGVFTISKQHDSSTTIIFPSLSSWISSPFSLNTFYLDNQATLQLRSNRYPICIKKRLLSATSFRASPTIYFS